MVRIVWKSFLFLRKLLFSEFQPETLYLAQSSQSFKWRRERLIFPTTNTRKSPRRDRWLRQLRKQGYGKRTNATIIQLST